MLCPQRLLTAPTKHRTALQSCLFAKFDLIHFDLVYLHDSSYSNLFKLLQLMLKLCFITQQTNADDNLR